MKARLTDGSIVDLPRDCDCLTHDGPHWLYMDTHTKQRLQVDYVEPITAVVELGAAATSSQVYHAMALAHQYAELQLVRLGELRRNMERLGIVELLRSEP